MKAAIFMLVAAFMFFSGVPILFAASQPSIVEVSRTPLNPTPTTSVNVTCNIEDKYGLVSVSLYFALNGESPSTVAMQIIDGDYYNGTFIGQIPTQPSGTVVQYYVVARDSIGYLAQTPKETYQVSFDTSPPTINSVERTPPVGWPVLPTDNVTIEAWISDDGSGVKNVSLFFALGKDLYNTNFSESQMTRIDGNSYNGSYLGTIGEYANGSIVSYFVDATDMANNTVHGALYDYAVVEPKPSYIDISIDFSSIDMQNLTATVDMTTTAYLPSEDEPNIFYIDVYNGLGQNALANAPLFWPVNSSFEAERFFYENMITWNVHLMGSPNNYPYDTYFLNFTFNIFWSQPGSLNIQGAYFKDYDLARTWNTPTISYQKNVTDSYGRPIVIATIDLERNPVSVLPITLLITLLFFVLGGTMFVEPTRLNERITVYLAVFVFVAGFFFSLSSLVPFRLGLTVAEILVLSLVTGSALFVIGSFFSKAISIHFEDARLRSKRGRFIIHNAGIFTDFILGIILVYFLSLYGVLNEIPLWQLVSIIIGIFYGLTFRAIIPFVKKHV